MIVVHDYQLFFHVLILIDVSSACPISTDYDYTTCLDTEDQQRHATVSN